MTVEVESFLERFFQHKNGAIYRLEETCLTQIGEDWHDFVVYRNVKGDLFSRSAEDFFGGSFKLLDIDSGFKELKNIS